jgi:hypothetical protein
MTETSTSLAYFLKTVETSLAPFSPVGRSLSIRAVFSGEKISFEGARFTSGEISFTEAKFTSSLVSFGGAEFMSGAVSFYGAQFTGRIGGALSA